MLNKIQFGLVIVYFDLSFTHLLVPDVLRQADHVVLAVDHQGRPHDALHPVHRVAVLVIILDSLEAGKSMMTVKEFLDISGSTARLEGLWRVFYEYVWVLIEEEMFAGVQEVFVHLYECYLEIGFICFS